MFRTSAIATACTAAILAHVGTMPAIADTIRQFGDGPADGPFRDVSRMLDQVGIGRDNAAAETVVETYRVPGDPQTMQDLTFTFVRDTGRFQFSFGYFDASKVTADPVANPLDWAVQALSTGVEIFDDRTVAPGATTDVAIPSGMEVGFFLIPHNTLNGFLSDPGSFYQSSTSDALRSPLFSMAQANPGQLDQMLSFIGNGKTVFTFEDLTRTQFSDQDFTDLTFTVDREFHTPEPSGFVLAGLAFFGALAARRQRRWAKTRMTLHARAN